MSRIRIALFHAKLYVASIRRTVNAVWACCREEGFRETVARIGRVFYWRGHHVYLRLVRRRRAITYDQWRAFHAPRPVDLDQMSRTLPLFTRQPLISVIMPVYNPAEEHLREAIESVLAQIYPNWELCIADDASTAPHVRPLLERYAAKDSRIKVVYRSTNGHISRTSNDALKLSEGEFVALLDHDDLLTPDAFYHVIQTINQHPDADLIYSDEDRVDETGNFVRPYFKPQWSPETLLGHMYLTHLSVYRRSLVMELGGFRPEFDGSQDYDLALRFTERTDRIHHIPRVLYHWRVHSASAASSSLAKPYAYDAAQRALEDALVRRNTPGSVHPIPYLPGFFTVRYERKLDPLVSIIIVVDTDAAALEKCLDSIFLKSSYQHFEIVIDYDPASTDVAACVERWRRRQPAIRVTERTGTFNYAVSANRAAQTSSGSVLVFLDADTEVVTTDWIEALLEHIQNPAIGAAAPKLVFRHGGIHHPGIASPGESIAVPVYRTYLSSLFGSYAQMMATTNYSALSGACLMCRKEYFDSVGGFDERFANGYYDIDFCLRLLDRGLRNVWAPHVLVAYHASRRRNKRVTSERSSQLNAERAMFDQRWRPVIENDRYYSPHLSRESPWFFIRPPEARRRVAFPPVREACDPLRKETPKSAGAFK